MILTPRTRAALYGLKCRVDNEIASKGAARFQERCVRCGGRCMRRYAGQQVNHAKGELLIRVDGMRFELQHDPIQQTVELLCSAEGWRFDYDVIGRTIQIHCEEGFSPASFFADYLWMELVESAEFANRNL